MILDLACAGACVYDVGESCAAMEGDAGNVPLVTAGRVVFKG